jgi:hypothetical protein
MPPRHSASLERLKSIMLSAIGFRWPLVSITSTSTRAMSAPSAWNPFDEMWGVRRIVAGSPIVVRLFEAMRRQPRSYVIASSLPASKETLGNVQGNRLDWILYSRDSPLIYGFALLAVDTMEIFLTMLLL